MAPTLPSIRNVLDAQSSDLPAITITPTDDGNSLYTDTSFSSVILGAPYTAKSYPVTDLGTHVLFDVFPALSSIPGAPILSVKFDSDIEWASATSIRFSSRDPQDQMESSLRFVTRCIGQSPSAKNDVLTSLENYASCLALVPGIVCRFSEYYKFDAEFHHPDPTTTTIRWDRTRDRITKVLRQMSQWSEQVPGSVYPDKAAISLSFGTPRSLGFRVILSSVVQSIMDHLPEKLGEAVDMFFEGGLMDTLLQALIPDIYDLIRVDGERRDPVVLESLKAGQGVLFFGRD